MIIENAREVLERLRRTAVEAPTLEERQAALQEYEKRVELHTRPTERELECVVLP